MTLVSIVTPTFPGREKELLERCIPSVNDLDWDEQLEHVIVSDRNPHLAAQIARLQRRNSTFIRFAEINESWRNPITESSIGAIPWYVGSLMAMGEFVGFLGDDDELLPDHVLRHVEAMKMADALFSISQVEFKANGEHYCIIGDDTFAHGHLDATGIMCHKLALRMANWSANGENAADYRLVRDWQQAGLKGVYVGDGPTGIHHDGWVVGRTGRADRPQ